MQYVLIYSVKQYVIYVHDMYILTYSSIVDMI